MKTAPDDIAPHPDFQSKPDTPAEIPPPVPANQPEPAYPGVTPDRQPEADPVTPGVGAGYTGPAKTTSPLEQRHPGERQDP